MKRAQEVLVESTGSVPPRRDPPEVGNLHDNEAVIAAARARLADGDSADAIYMLAFLRDHIRSSPDPKSKRLLPEVLEMLREAGAGERDGAALNDGVRRECEPLRAPSTGKMDDAASRIPRNRRGTESHRLKGDLLDAMVLVTTVTYGVGLLVHEIVVVLPTLAASPITANVVAASAWGITLFVVRLRGR